MCFCVCVHTEAEGEAAALFSADSQCSSDLEAESISLNIPFKVACDSKSPSSRESWCTASHLIYFLTFTGRFSNMQNVIEYKIPAELARTTVTWRCSKRLRIPAGLNVTHVAMTLFVYTLCSQGIALFLYSSIQIHFYTIPECQNIRRMQKKRSFHGVRSL